MLGGVVKCSGVISLVCGGFMLVFLFCLIVMFVRVVIEVMVRWLVVFFVLWSWDLSLL